MKRVLHKRLQLQLLFALLAAVSVAALAFEMVSIALRHAESFVLADSSRALREATAALRREYAMRISSDSAWSSLPAGAQDLSLRAITNAVLSAYPGIEGGCWIDSRLLGRAFPSFERDLPRAGMPPPPMDLPPREGDAIRQLLQQAGRQGYTERVLRTKFALVVIGASTSGGITAWSMKRMPGRRPPGEPDRGTLFIALIAVALLGAAGVLTTAIALRRGVSQIKQGLARLDLDFTEELPVRNDELGEISAAINRMAQARRQLEAEARRDDRLRTTGRLVAQVAHEMRNPLNSIRLSLQMLSHRLAANKLRVDDFQIVVDEVDRMNRLLSDLLAFQQPRPAALKASPLCPLAERCLEMVRPQAVQREVRLALTCEDDAVIASVDEHYFKQIIVNVLLNAIDASGPNSTVTVHVGIVDGAPEIRIRDQGPGLTTEQEEHLFEPFYTTKPDGHGLGLAVSRELAQSMGGDLVYCPSSDTGATFVLRMQGLEHVF